MSFNIAGMEKNLTHTHTAQTLFLQIICNGYYKQKQCEKPLPSALVITYHIKKSCWIFKIVLMFKLTDGNIITLIGQRPKNRERIDVDADDHKSV